MKAIKLWLLLAALVVLCRAAQAQSSLTIGRASTTQTTYTGYFGEEIRDVPATALRITNNSSTAVTGFIVWYTDLEPEVNDGTGITELLVRNPFNPLVTMTAMVTSVSATERFFTITDAMIALGLNQSTSANFRSGASIVVQPVYHVVNCRLNLPAGSLTSAQSQTRWFAGVSCNPNTGVFPPLPCNVLTNPHATTNIVVADLVPGLQIQQVRETANNSPNVNPANFCPLPNGDPTGRMTFRIRPITNPTGYLRDLRLYVLPGVGYVTVDPANFTLNGNVLNTPGLVYAIQPGTISAFNNPPNPNPHPTTTTNHRGGNIIESVYADADPNHTAYVIDFRNKVPAPPLGSPVVPTGWPLEDLDNDGFLDDLRPSNSTTGGIVLSVNYELTACPPFFSQCGTTTDESMRIIQLYADYTSHCGTPPYTVSQTPRSLPVGPDYNYDPQGSPSAIAPRDFNGNGDVVNMRFEWSHRIRELDPQILRCGTGNNGNGTGGQLFVRVTVPTGMGYHLASDYNTAGGCSPSPLTGTIPYPVFTSSNQTVTNQFYYNSLNRPKNITALTDLKDVDACSPATGTQQMTVTIGNLFDFAPHTYNTGTGALTLSNVTNATLLDISGRIEIPIVLNCTERRLQTSTLQLDNVQFELVWRCEDCTGPDCEAVLQCASTVATAHCEGPCPEGPDKPIATGTAGRFPGNTFPPTPPATVDDREEATDLPFLERITVGWADETGIVYGNSTARGPGGVPVYRSTGYTGISSATTPNAPDARLPQNTSSFTPDLNMTTLVPGHGLHNSPIDLHRVYEEDVIELVMNGEFFVGSLADLNSITAQISYQNPLLTPAMITPSDHAPIALFELIPEQTTFAYGLKNPNNYTNVTYNPSANYSSATNYTHINGNTAPGSFVPSADRDAMLPNLSTYNVTIDPTAAAAFYTWAVAQSSGSTNIVFFIRAKFKVRRGILPPGQQYDLQPRMMFTAQVNNQLKTSCDGWGQDLALMVPKTYTRVALFGNTNNTATCGFNPVTITTYLRPAAISGNDFPNEFRNFYRLPSEVKVQIPAGFILVEKRDVNGYLTIDYFTDVVRNYSGSNPRLAEIGLISEPLTTTTSTASSNKTIGYYYDDATTNILTIKEPIDGWPVADVNSNFLGADQVQGLIFEIRPLCGEISEDVEVEVIQPQNYVAYSHAHQLDQTPPPSSSASLVPSTTDASLGTAPFSFSAPEITIATANVTRYGPTVSATIEIRNSGSSPITDGYLAVRYNGNPLAGPYIIDINGAISVNPSTSTTTLHRFANDFQNWAIGISSIGANTAITPQRIIITFNNLSCNATDQIEVALYRRCERTNSTDPTDLFLEFDNVFDCELGRTDIDLNLASPSIEVTQISLPNQNTYDLCEEIGPFIYDFESNGEAATGQIVLTPNLPLGFTVSRITANGSPISAPILPTDPWVISHSLPGTKSTPPNSLPDRQLRVEVFFNSNCSYSGDGTELLEFNLDVLHFCQQEPPGSVFSNGYTFPITLNDIPTAPGGLGLSITSDPIPCADEQHTATLTVNGPTNVPAGESLVVWWDFPIDQTSPTTPSFSAPLTVLGGTTIAGGLVRRFEFDVTNQPTPFIITASGIPLPAGGTDFNYTTTGTLRWGYTLACGPTNCPTVYEELANETLAVQRVCSPCDNLLRPVVTIVPTGTIYPCQVIEVAGTVTNPTGNIPDLTNPRFRIVLPPGFTLTTGGPNQQTFEARFPTLTGTWVPFVDNNLTGAANGWVESTPGITVPPSGVMDYRFYLQVPCDADPNNLIVGVYVDFDPCPDEKGFEAETLTVTPPPIVTITLPDPLLVSCEATTTWEWNVAGTLPVGETYVFSVSFPDDIIVAGTLVPPAGGTITTSVNTVGGITTVIWAGIQGTLPPTFSFQVQPDPAADEDCHQGADAIDIEAQFISTTCLAAGSTGANCSTVNQTQIEYCCEPCIELGPICAGHPITPTALNPDWTAPISTSGQFRHTFAIASNPNFNTIPPFFAFTRALDNQLLQGSPPDFSALTIFNSPSVPGIYWVIYQVEEFDLARGEWDEIRLCTTQVTVHPNPTGFIQLTGCSPFCDDQTVELSVIAAPPLTGLFNGIVSWVDASGNSDPPTVLSTDNPFEVDAATVGMTNGFIRAIITDPLTGCSSECPAIHLETTPTPEVDLGDDIAICAGQTPPILEVLPFDPDFIYEWYRPDGSLIIGNVGNRLNVSPTEPGTYRVRVGLQSGGCCICWGEDDVEVSISEVTVSLQPVTICQGGQATLTPNVTGGIAPLTFTWTPPITPVDPATGAITVNQAGPYTVTVTDIRGCSGTATTTVTVDEPLDINFDFPDMCPGHITLSVLAPGNNVWTVTGPNGQLPPITLSSTSGPQTFDFPVNQIGPYTVRLEVGNTCGTATFEDDFKVEEGVAIESCAETFGNPYCPGETATIVATNAYVTVNWYKLPDRSTIVATTNTPDNRLVIGGSGPDALGPGSYIGIAIDEKGCTHECICAAVSERVIPEVVLPTEATICDPLGLMLTPTVTWAAGDVNDLIYIWSNGATTRNTTVTAPGSYTLTVLTPTNAGSCEQSFTVNVAGSSISDTYYRLSHSTYNICWDQNANNAAVIHIRLDAPPNNQNATTLTAPLSVYWKCQNQNGTWDNISMTYNGSVSYPSARFRPALQSTCLWSGNQMFVKAVLSDGADGCVTCCNVERLVTLNCAQGRTTGPAIAPNPASNSFTLFYELSADQAPAYMEVYDAIGQLIRTEELLIDETQMAFDVPDLASGLYHVTIKAKDYHLTEGIKLLIIK